MGLGTKTKALDKGIAKVGAFRVHPDDQREIPANKIAVVTRLEYAYFAGETDSYWLVSEDSLHRLGAMNLDYNDWAEADDSAQEFGKRAPRRAL